MTSSAIASTVGGMIRPSLFEKYWIDPNLAFGASDAHEPDMISASPPQCGQLVPQSSIAIEAPGPRPIVPTRGKMLRGNELLETWKNRATN